MKQLLSFLLIAVVNFSSSAQSKWAHIKIIENGNSFKGILTNDGKELIKPIYDSIVFTDNIFFCQRDNKWGCIDSLGQILIVPQFEDVRFGIGEGLLSVKKSGKWGYVGLSGETRIDYQYDFACNFQNGKAYVIINGESKFISKTNLHIDTTEIGHRGYCDKGIGWEEVLVDQFHYDKSLTVKKSNEKFGVLDTTGNTIIPIEFDEIGIYYNDVIEVRKGILWGAYTNKGKLVREPSYNGLGLFNSWRK